MRWRIWIESDPVEPEDWAARVDALLDSLAESEDVSGSVGWGVGHTLGSVFEVEGHDVAEAFAVGHGAFASALTAAARDPRTAIRRVEIAPADFEPLELLGATDVARALGLSRQRVYQLTEQPGFPRPARRLARGALWDRGEIEAWREQRRASPLLGALASRHETAPPACSSPASGSGEG